MEAAGKLQKHESGGGVTAGVWLREFTREGIHLLAEIAVAHDGLAPLAHEIVQLRLFAVMVHPAKRA